MPMSRWLVIAAIVAAAGCGSSSSPNPPPPPGPPPPPPPPTGGHSTTITVSNNQFLPRPDTIPAGNITFHWSAGAITHNVTWDGGPTTPAGSGNRADGDPDFVASLSAGTYTYHCSIHGASMSGSIVVTP
jgi:plastocyanin